VRLPLSFQALAVNTISAQPRHVIDDGIRPGWPS
jgi:hypothetical protein